MSVFLLVLGLILFVALVVVHEFGHFIAARRGGVEVEEFGIGFPPRAKTLAKKHGTIFTLNWLPLGGFVRLKGENDDATETGSFGAASLKTKVKIMLAGVAMNLATAYVLLTFSALVGLPKVLPHQFTVPSDTAVSRQELYIGYVEPNGPADKAGFQERDKLKSIGYQCIETCPSAPDVIKDAESLPQLTRKYAGQYVSVVFERDGQESAKTVKLRTVEEVETSQQTAAPKGYLGIGPTEFILRRSTWSAPIVVAGLIKQFTIETFKGIGVALSGLFRGDGAKASEQVSGPVGVFVLLKDGSLLGFEFILFIIAVISLTLAIMNVLPIPALDGGRLFVTLLFRILKKPLRKSTEDRIHGIGFGLLMLLFVVITIVDIKRFF